MEEHLYGSGRLQMMHTLAGCLFGDQLPVSGSQLLVAKLNHTIAAQGAAPHGAILRPALRCNKYALDQAFGYPGVVREERQVHVDQRVCRGETLPSRRHTAKP